MHRLAGRLPKLARNHRGLASNSSSNGNSLAVGAATVLVGGGAITVGMAWKVPSFRKTVEENVPPMKNLFNPILGPLDDSVTSPGHYSSQSKVDLFEAPMKETRKRMDDNQDISSHLPTHSIEETSLPEKVQSGSNESITELVIEPPLLPSIPLTDELLDPVKDSASKEHETFDSKDISDQPNNTTNTLMLPCKEETVTVNEEKLESTTSVADSTTGSPGEIESKLLRIEENDAVDESAMSAILDDTLSSCASQCSEAIDSNKEAAEAIGLHTSLLKAAMNESQDLDENSDKWTDLSRVLEQKSRLQSQAETLANDARLELTKLEEVMSQFRESRSETIKRKILQVEETCNEMRRELEASVTDVNMKLSESHVISQYKDLVDTAKEQFRQELMSIVPDVKLESGWRKLSQKLSNDDLNALIAHAHRRVDQLQRELAEERAIAINRIIMAVKTAREKWEENAALEMKHKVNIIKHETEIEHNKKLADVRQDFENEMRIQLKRQAAAHSDHLAEVLGIQEKEIKRQMGEEFNNSLAEQEKNFSEKMEEIKVKYEEDVQQISEQFQFNLNRALAKVAGIETAVDGRAHVENESRKAQELFLACEALRISVQYGDEGKPVPLQKELQAINNVPGIESHIRDIVDAFPTEASERGVFTEDALRTAYKQVAKICRRVSLITETRNSFFDYILSYLKSLLIITRAQVEPPRDLDTNTLDTYSIISYATYCLEHGDLEQAARFINQLTGESRRVAEGWLDEARLLLETRQVLEVLSAIATATTIAANLELQE